MIRCSECEQLSLDLRKITSGWQIDSLSQGYFRRCYKQPTGQSNQSVLGRTWRWIIGRSVSAFLRSTICINPKAGLVVQSAMPKTRHTSCWGSLSRWCFGLWANIDSSRIWTIRLPGPARRTGFRRSAALQTSLRKLYISTSVLKRSKNSETY